MKIPICFVDFYKFLIALGGVGQASSLLEIKHKTGLGLNIGQEFDSRNARGFATKSDRTLISRPRVHFQKNCIS